MRRTRPPYSPEFRRQMVDLIQAGRDPADLAREFEPSVESIRAGVAQASSILHENGAASPNVSQTRPIIPSSVSQLRPIRSRPTADKCRPLYLMCYLRVASIMLNGECVGITRTSWKPASARRC